MKTFRTLFVMVSMVLPVVAFADPKPPASKPTATASKEQPKTTHKHHSKSSTTAPSTPPASGDKAAPASPTTK
jgi:hypothetical protein